MNPTMKKRIFCSVFLAAFTLGINALPQQTDTEYRSTEVIYDSISIKSIGKKASMIRFNFDRSARVKINSDEGIETFKTITLPEPLDPTLIIHAPLERNVGKYLTNIRIEYFKVRITKSDGSISEPNIIPDIQVFKSVDILEDKYGEYQKYLFNIPGLEHGDVLDLKYSFSVLYNENFFNLLTFRIFFHDKFPVKNKSLQFQKEHNLDTQITSVFCDDPREESNKIVTFSWHFDNLVACMDESGIRPYKVLPHVIISIMPDEMVYTVPYTFDEKYIPFYSIGPSQREDRHLAIVRSMLNGVNSKQYNQVRDYIEKRTKNLAEDSSGYNQLYAVHNHIAENFIFDPDIEYFNRLDIRDERLGDYLTEGVIRDRSRYNIYAALIAGLELNYFTAYLADKRSGVISEPYFEPTISNDYLFAVLLTTNDIQFIYPKKARFGYYLNELPFYFEDTKARLIYLDDFRDYKKGIEEKFVSVNTPPSKSQDNVRTQAAIVSIDLDSRSVSFDASISLSGQFSTMGRGAYLYDYCDETVNSQYCTKIWESISPETEPGSFEIKEITTDFPYKASFSASFQDLEAINISNDTITLDIGGWFNHIVDDNLNAANRALTYYPDFMYTDSCNYMVSLNKKVKVIDHLPILEINNAYGSLALKCIQKLDGSILLSSRVIVPTEKVSPENINAVDEIQKELRKLHSMKIRMIIVD
jgi:hypothetical protein